MDIQKLVESVVDTIMTKCRYTQSDIRNLMKNALELMYEKYPVFFEDLYEKFVGEVH